jgi:hypothetical protein
MLIEYKEATKMLCMRNGITLSLVIPTMQRIRFVCLEPAENDSPALLALKNAIRNGVIRRFPIESSAENYNPAWMKATYLDPR